MTRTGVQISITCARCLRAYHRQNAATIIPSCHRAISSFSPHQSSQASNPKVDDENLSTSGAPETGQTTALNTLRIEDEPEVGAMSRRLAEATEDALLEGGRAGKKAIEEAGFSEEMKEKLLSRIEMNKFRSENASAFAEAGLSSAAGRGTRDIAAGQAWTGTEAAEDTVLRMLTDAHKPLKSGLRDSARGNPTVDLRIRREPKRTSGERLANARDKTSIYAISKDSGMNEQEREAMRKELKERFTPGARAIPHSFRGLAALANERIEDAIARGQFKNIPRGKAIERDPRADNPFIDTTEYIMNKMIQRQDIVPPWIEKQQELVKAVKIFRGRLRNDWKRHAARMISSRGGPLQEQVRTAELYAQSERIHNPKTKAVEQIAVPTSLTNDPVMVKITQEAPRITGTEAPPPVVQVLLELKDSEVPITDPVPVPFPQADAVPTQPSSVPPQPLPALFRDINWENAERSYLTLAITNLNNLTRSYNLMAPDLAKKPYFNIDRELRSCYADVAPQLGQAIIDRAAKPDKQLVEKVGHKPGGVMERFSSETARVYDSKKPLYGFKEFWNDLFGGKEKRA
jgi:hypothetical protein